MLSTVGLLVLFVDRPTEFLCYRFFSDAAEGTTILSTSKRTKRSQFYYSVVIQRHIL